MNIDQLIAVHAEKTSRKKPIHHFANQEYRNYYPLIRDAVKKDIPMMSAIKIVREKDSAFQGKTDKAVWQAFNRALIHDELKNANVNRASTQPE